MTRCTHGGIATNIAVGARCPYCAQIVTVEADVTHPHPVARGEVSGSAGALDGTLREFAPEVSADGNAAAGSSSLVVRLGGNHRSVGPNLPPGPSPARGLPCANAQPGPSLHLTPAESGNKPGDAVVALGGTPAPVRPFDSGTAGQAPGQATPVPTLLDLIDATPVARSTDPDTAHDAARGARGRLTADMRLVLAAHVAAGERGLTGAELAAVTRRPYESVGPRRKPLEVAGLVEKAERRPKDPAYPNGSQVWAYRATGAGRDAYATELASSAA